MIRLVIRPTLRPMARWPSSTILGVVGAIVAISAAARRATACECAEFDEAAAMQGHAIVFDGWVIEAPSPWRCPLPPAPKPRKGCVRVAVVDRRDCTVHGDLLGLDAGSGSDRTGVFMTSLEHDGTTFCGIKAGTYTLTGERWMGDDDGTLTYGRALAVVPGGSYVVYGIERPGQALRVGVFQALKGQVRREVRVTTEASCGMGVIRAGASLRFYGDHGPDGSVMVKGCSGVRDLTEQERASAVVPGVAAAAPAPPASPPPSSSATTARAPVTAKARTGGCQSSSTTGLGLGVLVGIALLARRRAGASGVTPGRRRRHLPR
jgi:hypothetical protein